MAKRSTSARKKSAPLKRDTAPRKPASRGRKTGAKAGKARGRTAGKADIGIIGLAVMGQNLALNFQEHGCTVAVFNRTEARTDAFLRRESRRKRLLGARTLKQFTGLLKKPRKVMLMVRAGEAVDELIRGLTPLLSKGDVIIDGGDSRFADTERRARSVQSKGLGYLGAGMYGGQEGARRGPAIIAGGSEQAWESVRPVFEQISARIAKLGKEELSCCYWAGPGGAGHFLKTVHIGMAYGELQILCEAYHLMKERLGLTPEATAEAFREWNWGKTKSHLIEITAKILALPDSDGQPLVEKVRDTAGRKGGGRRAAEAAIDLGLPATVLHAALDARLLSAMKAERAAAAKRLGGPLPRPAGEVKPFLANMADAVFAARVVNHAQGFAVLRAAGRARGWKLNLAAIARNWNGGSILRSDLMEKIDEAHRRNADLENILMDPYFGVHVEMAQPAWRRVLAEGAGCGIPLPAISAALAFYDGYRRERLPANLLQAQRDCLGAHAYERIDMERGEFFHTDWTGEGGKATATVYSE